MNPVIKSWLVRHNLQMTLGSECDAEAAFDDAASTVTTHYNQLSPAQAERLALLSEECAEAIQAIGKILRHGYESHHPDDPHNSNRGLLEDEVGDIICAMRIMCEAGDLRENNIGKREMIKKIKVQQYLHHQ